MAQESGGGDLFVVDNSDEGWTGLRYLQEWTEIAKSFDIATGFFEIGSLLDLDGRWQQLEKIRILMGDEMTHRTRRALNDAVRARTASSLDNSLETEKEVNPFLTGVPAIVDALKSRQIDCRIYDRSKFHAKAYITHAKLDVVGAKALVGSSNFTRPGLTKNVELNIQVQSAGDVAQLQEWFDRHWADAVDVTEEVVATILRHARPFTPFEIYAKALQEFFEGHQLTASEWEDSESDMFPVLDRYQKEAYWGLLQIARRHGGAFLCDGVGLGKTFVGLMLIERFVMLEGKRVVLLAPKGAKEGVWEKDLAEYLPRIGGSEASQDFSNLTVFSHTDLNRKNEFPERFARVAELADVVIVDEAHHFRNPGQKADPDTGTDSSRYYKLFDLLDPAVRPKQLFMLTATPVNNRLSDFRHMAELFSRRQDNYFAHTLGVNNLTAHFNNLEKTLRGRLGLERADLSDSLVEAGETLAQDETFRALVVQRSRAYAKASQIQERGDAAVFPDRGSPKVADYSIKKTYGHLLDMVERAFEKREPLFSLAIYYPLEFYTGPKDIDPFLKNRQQQVVGLIRTLFLKRFESSVYAFDTSCFRLMQKLLAFLEKNSETDKEKRRLEKWRRMNEEELHYVVDRQMLLWGEDPNADNGEEDMIPPEFLELFETLPRDEYDVDQIMDETYSDLEQLVRFLQETRKFQPKQDDKLNKLKRLLKSKDVGDEKVLIFTEFADTARYLSAELEGAGFQDVEQVDSGRALGKKSRADVIERFAPYYNRTSSSELAKNGREEIKILVSTDIMSEGLNLQDATRLINYDIHWNPVRLMQRIGRVDRRLNPEIEERLKTDHPDKAASRGKVAFWNFLPPDELNDILSLYKTVTGKALLISKAFGIEGKKLLRPEDDFEALKEFNHEYEGDRTAIEDMLLEYQALVQSSSGLEDELRRLPMGMFSGRKRPAQGVRGVFLCYRLPALDKEKMEFTEEAGGARWYLYDLDSEAILEEPGQIVESIRSKPNTPRKCVDEQTSLVAIRDKVSKHITNTYLKRIDAPVGVRPRLVCWMELNDG